MILDVNLKGCRQYLAVFLCTLSVAASAVTVGWIEPLVLRMKDEFNFTPTEISWYISFLSVGEIVLALPSGVLADRYGRKLVLLTTGPLGLLSWALVLASKSTFSLYTCRFLQGVLIVIVFTVAPLYIAEIAEPKVRGTLSGHFQTMWSIGLLYTYSTGPYMDLTTYLLVCSILALCFTIFFAFMPETPYYLFMVHEDEKARKALSWVRGNESIEKELESIKTSVVKDLAKKSSWKDVFATKKDIRIFLIVQFLCIIKYMTGVPAMSNYASHTFSNTSHGALNEHTAAIIYGLLMLFSAFFGALLSDSVGRRPMLLGSLLLIGVSYSVTSAYFYLLQYTDLNMDSLSWIVYSTVGLSAVLGNAGVNSILQTVQAELFPSHTRATGGALTGITAGIFVAVDILHYQYAIDIFGLYMNFAIYSFFAFLGTVVVYYALNETAKRSLGEIQSDLDVN